MGSFEDVFEKKNLLKSNDNTCWYNIEIIFYKWNDPARKQCDPKWHW